MTVWHQLQTMNFFMRFFFTKNEIMLNTERWWLDEIKHNSSWIAIVWCRHDNNVVPKSSFETVAGMDPTFACIFIATKESFLLASWHSHSHCHSRIKLTNPCLSIKLVSLHLFDAYREKWKSLAQTPEFQAFNIVTEPCILPIFHHACSFFSLSLFSIWLDRIHSVRHLLHQIGPLLYEPTRREILFSLTDFPVLPKEDKKKLSKNWQNFSFCRFHLLVVRHHLRMEKEINECSESCLWF